MPSFACISGQSGQGLHCPQTEWNVCGGEMSGYDFVHMQD